MDESPSRPPSTSSSLKPKSTSPIDPLQWAPEEQRQLDDFRNRGAAVLATARPNAEQTLRLAKQLIGSWPHGRADDPATYAAAIAAALRDYPSALAAECCDPRVGLARKREMMPTVFAVHDWCQERMKFYRCLVAPRLVDRKPG